MSEEVITTKAVEVKKNTVKRGLQIEPEAFEKILGDLFEEGVITKKCIEPMQWIYRLARNKSMSQSEIAAIIDIDTSAVSRLFSGKYTGSYVLVCNKITAAQERHQKQANSVHIEYCETSTWRKIKMACDMALNDGLPAYIYGDSQIGKSAALERYCALNGKGYALYVRLESSPTKKGVIKAIAEALGMNAIQNEETLKARIKNKLDTKYLLIVDELHQALISAGERTGIRIIELLREIRDVSGCGVVMCGTRVLKDRLQDSENEKIYGQFAKRGLLKIMVQTMPTQDDMTIICGKFGLKPPTGEVELMISSMIKANGIGRFINLLKYTAKFCRSQKEPIPLTWGEFDNMVKTIESWAEG